MNAKRSRKYNMRRKFFNSEKPNCRTCGSVLVEVKDLKGNYRGQLCPLNH